ncbi:Ras GTPase activating protein ira2 [Apophysomyces ossiformis]|uniref:Ras GTPase activating protein ira2 n=1 Tax=Apophysomyces ossiformis TaxID=679940 RepID=A0A8H7BRY8_9FUNG|nr:Ras GTPase activating protein ira2 [Apophysomyces ossiformis]
MAWTQTPSISINEEFVPYDVLQSQLFLLRMLSACMQHHWQFVRESRSEAPTLVPHKDGSTNSIDMRSAENHPADLEDPPPLDDTCAKYVVAIMSRFMHQMTVMEERDLGLATNHATNITRTEYYTTNCNVAGSTSDIMVDIYKAASRIVFYVSASNWPVVFAKIKTRILYLSTTTDENPETADMRLLECCALNAKRLSTVLAELCATFLHLKKSAQLVVAVVLRRAIWGWIETYPSEFMRLCYSQKRLEGGPEILFDICNSLADTTRKKAILWPLQILLLILCPDLLLSSTVSENRGINTKKTVFLNALRKSLKGGRMAELSIICYVDICKAATYVSKSDVSALRHIVPEVENELREKLFDMERPLLPEGLMGSLGIVIDHRCLLADGLVAMFRLNPRNVMHSLFPACLSDRAPTVFKLSLVKACLAIASEENRLPWNPSVSTLYESMCGPLRRLFLEITSRDPAKSETSSQTTLTPSRKTIIGSASADKRMRKDIRLDTNNDRLEMILDILRLYQADPNMAIKGDNTDRFEQNAAVMVAITNCLREPSAAVRDAAAECLYSLHSPNYILEWGPSERFMESFWKTSSQVVFALAKQLLDNREKDEGLKKLLDLLKKLLKLRNEFLRMQQDIAMQGADVRERLQASIGLEVALLVLLCSADTDICSAAIACFGYICVEVHITDSVEDPHQAALTIVENLPIYVELTSNTGIVTGRKSQQKRIRRLLRMMTHYAPGNLAAWEEAWKRWKYMTPAITRAQEETKEETIEAMRKGGQAWHDKLRNNSNRQTNYLAPRAEGLDDDKSSEWQNYAGFLAALGGICLMTDAPPASPVSPATPREYETQRRVSAPSESATMVDKFVMEMVELLLCDNVIVREWVKEILGTDLSPALYPILFRHLETVLGKCFGPDGDPICSPRYTLFVEQAISVLKFVLDRMEESTENLFTVDFSGLMDQYAKYLNKLGIGQASLKIKIKFCQLCEVLMAKKDRVTLRQEFRLRNKLLEIIVEWTSDFCLKCETGTGYASASDSAQSQKLHRELDLSCLKTIVGLLHQLPLQPSEPVHETDAAQVKSRIFYKYFTFFLKLLNRCRISEVESNALPMRSPEMLLPKNKDSTTYLAPLKDFTILAMSNLLSANVDAGLKYSLSMGYHEDTRMRSAFMQVLTNILNQGTEFETLAETVMTDRYEKIVDMLVEYDMNIVLSLCEVCPAPDVDDVANALLACFSSRGKAMDLLKAVIEKEVQNTDSETELFRRTSIATRLLSVFAKINGAQYVQSVLQPVFYALADKPPEERTFELDSSKVDAGEDVSKNKQNVVNATEMFLNAICASANEAPRCFREVCHYILTSVRERFPEAKYTAVGAFIFLRFFCPAIVAPESEGLIKSSSISREMRRGHLIATKVIQNLANNVLFGAKETYMIVLNDFLTINIYKVTSFLREISNVPSSTEETRTAITPMDEKDYAMLHRVLADNMERISRDLATRRLRMVADQESVTASKRHFDKFSNLLAQLGRPPAVTKKEFNGLRSYTFAAANQLYAEFMRRNSHRSVESIVSKNIFYESGTSKAGRPVFYFIARNVIADSIDFELLIYYMLQILEPAANKSIEVVLDMTLFSPSNEVPNQWISQTMQLLPFDVYDNVATIHLYNPNSHLRKYIKKLPRPVTHKLSRRITFAVTLAELHEHILPTELRLPKSTMALDTEPCAVFYPVNRLSQYRINIPVTVKVGAEYIQVMTVRKQELLYGVSTVTNDVYHISEVEDISIGQHGRGTEATNELSFKYNKGKSQVILSTPKREAVVGTIRHSKRRYEMTKPSNISERTIRPNDVPGRLLNMALLNIGSEDPNLRLSAYNLLYALSMTFNFDVGKQLLDARDLCLPANSTAFIVNISEKLAAAEPSLTLEFLSECFLGFNKSSEPLRYLCLDYMTPWLPNLALFCQGTLDDTNQNLQKTKEVLRLLIDLTVARTDMYKLVQAKIWKTIGKIDDVLNLVLDAFVQFSNEHGVGSPQAEAMADTFVTLSNVAVRGKVISRLRKILQKTSFKPTRALTEHWTWTEIAVLIRFVLMLSFNNRGPVKSYVPEIFHIVSLVVGVGPTIIRASVHGLVVNMIQSLCTSMPLPEGNVKKLQLMLTEISDSKFRLLFGLLKSHANAFTITTDTMSDTAEPIQLLALESIVNTLLEVITYGAPSIDIANVWRARWMSLVASTAFQFNPAIQPRAFVVLGCLGREEVDDDLLYQILVALRGALAIFNESDPNLVLSIMMCLKNIVESLPPDSRYLLSLFWVAVSLVQINNGPTFSMAVELLLAVLRALDADEYFAGDSVVDVLLAARKPMADVARQLDTLCGVNFTSHFSFAMTCVFMKGLRYSNAKDTIYLGLTTFLNVECKRITGDGNYIEAHTLGYLAGLLPMAVKNESVKEVLRMAGMYDVELSVPDICSSGTSYHGVFDKLDIPDNTTALLLISMLATQLNSADNESERLFIYGLLAEAATSMPEVFAVVYDTLLPKMNQIVLSSHTQPIIESVKSILLTACSDPVFSEAKSKRSQTALLEEVGFSALGDPTFGAASTKVLQHAKLASEIIERIIA